MTVDIDVETEVVVALVDEVFGKLTEEDGIRLVLVWLSDEFCVEVTGTPKFKELEVAGTSVV